MPKIINDREKALIVEAIYQSTVDLIKRKGFNRVTVDDITREAGIAKGSFYQYYPTKEVCLYEAGKRAERELFVRMESLLAQPVQNKKMLVRLFHEVYLAKDSLALYIHPKDIEILRRKLPAEYAGQARQKPENYIERSMRLLNIDKSQINAGVLDRLVDSMAFIASGRDDRAANEQAMELIIDAIAKYLAGGMSNKHRKKRA
ncbi:MAG: TetR/AcrR family transcriptional regulator [Clostridia bacterium]|nr:TetR/AcrR family transcriptional regulator [Clostridia bacterium]